MKIKKTCLIKDKILMIAFSFQHVGRLQQLITGYKIFVFDMVFNDFSTLADLDAINPNFETLDYFYKNELNEQEFEKMFNLDWDFLKKTWESE